MFNQWHLWLAAIRKVDPNGPGVSSGEGGDGIEDVRCRFGVSIEGWGRNDLPLGAIPAFDQGLGQVGGELAAGGPEGIGVGKLVPEMETRDILFMGFSSLVLVCNRLLMFSDK